VIINCFGLHWAPGHVPFLVQPEGVTNLISPDLGNPFTLNLPGRGLKCPHWIDLERHAPAPDWLEDPLAQMFLPVPRGEGEKIKIILDRDDSLSPIINRLARLSSPIEPIIQPVWWRDAFTLRKRYQTTNLTPLVWTGVEASHTGVLDHMDMARVFNRRMLIVAREPLPIYHHVEVIQTAMKEVPVGDLEAVGTGALRRHMRDEGS
jgi:hypothetical protein